MTCAKMASRRDVAGGSGTAPIIASERADMRDERSKAARPAMPRATILRGTFALVATAAALLAPLRAAMPPAPVTLVVCAPGYPGSTDEARPAMDALASAVAARAGWTPSELTAVYFESEKGGLDRLAAAD